MCRPNTLAFYFTNDIVYKCMMISNFQNTNPKQPFPFLLEQICRTLYKITYRKLNVLRPLARRKLFKERIFAYMKYK